MSSIPSIPDAEAQAAALPVASDAAESTALAHLIVDTLADRQATDIVLLDLHAVSLIADYFVLASADSRRQIRALVDTIQETLHKRQLAPIRIEGTPESGWIIMDYSSVVIHLFDPEARAYYKLEQLWKNAPTVLRIQ